MKISANYGAMFNAKSALYPPAKPEISSDFWLNRNAVPHVSEKTVKKNKKLLNAGITFSSIAAAGTAVWYIVKNRNLSKIRDIITPLPENPIANSFPDFLKRELAINNKYEKLMQYIENPDKNNIAGIGANSTVYNIPFLDKYVLKILRPHKKAEAEKILINIFPENVNLGQAVWRHPEDFRVLLLKKVSGEPHSIKNWSNTIWDPKTKNALQVSKEESAEYYKKLVYIARMPQSAYDDMAQQIKILDSAVKMADDKYPGFKTDSINPNNLLVDKENGKLNIIDYFAKNKPQHQNSYMDIVSVISDFTLFREYYDLLGPEAQKNVLRAMKTVDSKAFKAAKKVGLSTDRERFIDFVNYTNKYFHIPNVPKYDGNGEYVRQYKTSAGYMMNLLDEIKVNPEIKFFD